MGRIVVFLAVLLAAAAFARPLHAQQPAVTYDARVLEITPDVVGRLLRALQAENAARLAATASAPEVKSEEEYQMCALQVVQSEDYMALMERLAEMAEDPARAVEAGKELERFMEERCGPSPYQSSVEPDDRDFIAAGMAAGALTDQQYAVLKERALPLCKLMAPPAADADGVVRLPSPGSDVFYAYGRGEVEALMARCGELLPALESR